MPLRKPKPVRMPMPFADPENSDDSAVRQRAIWMRLEMEDDPGYSWNRPRPSLFQRLIHTPLHKVLSSFIALLMACVIMGAFFFLMDAGIHPPTRLIFMESWSSDRTAADAIRDRDAAMDNLRARIEANRQALEAQEARERALAAERRAARAATS